MHRPELVELSVRDFVAAVASADQPVPAGGSVAALTGAASAALLALVSEVLERHTPGILAEPLQTARRLQRELLQLVDQDAAAFRSFLEAPRGSDARRAAGRGVAAAPLQIGRTCVQVVDLVRRVEPQVRGAMHLDVGAARQLAESAARSALDIAEYNLSLAAEPTLKAELREEISALRATLRMKS
ncbi:MAG: cyclodeaminase/cyclohydrolase family protein [Chloroflexi bacterium]|nr:cyclodeaminase/cyclohydrolase family protein [Chloroflexota bacterium]